MNLFEQLSPEQKYAFYKYRKGENVFVTGQGGSGKSFLIRAIVEDLRLRAKYEHEVLPSGGSSASTSLASKRVILPVSQRYGGGGGGTGKPPADTFAVTAMTGCAAILLQCGARTVHSWSGIGLGQGTVEEVIRKTAKNPRATKAWRTTKVLIVDEVSMMSKRLFDILNRVGQDIRRNPARPFGGIQLIFIGDFFQLPPVSRAGDPADSRLFCFQHPDWYRVFLPANHVYLRTVFRQRDPVFLQILEEVRQGQLSKESEELLRGHVGREVVATTAGVRPTQLFTTNARVDRVNQEMFSQISSQEYLYTMQQTQDLRTYLDSGLSVEAYRVLECQQMTMEERQRAFDTFADAQNLMQTVSLKTGANVMCLFNLDLDLGIVNGSQGIVEGFVAAPMAASKQGWSRGAFLVYDGPVFEKPAIATASVSSTPNSDSKEPLDLSMYELDEGSSFSPSSSSSALSSAVVSCQEEKMNIVLADEDEAAAAAAAEVPAAILDAQDLWFPVVRFANGVRAVVRPLVYQIQDFPTLGVIQLPLRLSYAITIHKSQGLTLDMAMMDLGRSVFEYGQTYVALSRLRSLEGLYLTGFAPEKIKTDPAVLEFAARFDTVQFNEELLAHIHTEVANDTRYKKRQVALAFSSSPSASTTSAEPHAPHHSFQVIKRQHSQASP